MATETRGYNQILGKYNDLLTVSDLAKIFSVSKQTVYKEMKAGKFGDMIKIGREYRVPRVYILQNFF
jgi:excisionase family DNA binding protein